MATQDALKPQIKKKPKNVSRFWPTTRAATTVLFFVFIGYAIVESPQIAAGLYVIDHVFFAMAIALKSYFKKIGDPKDFASTAALTASKTASKD